MHTCIHSLPPFLAASFCHCYCHYHSDKLQLQHYNAVFCNDVRYSGLRGQHISDLWYVEKNILDWKKKYMII